MMWRNVERNKQKYLGILSKTNINGIVDQLQTVPATEYPNRFENRWEEIKSISQIQMSLN